ncbi:MAG: LTA synthase family protein, partial [Muribaculaceae bacterium]|nr:LTA synthase family protein [Muribaculaceae bacterium]
MKKYISAFVHNVQTIGKRLAPDSARGVMTGLICIIYLKLLVFDLIWAFDTTFSCFQFPLGYLTKLAFATLLALPMLGFKSKWYAYPLCFVLDAWLIANLMYARTYYNVIPLSSYGLVNNLADFQESVWASLRWADILFPLTTFALIFAWRHTKVKKLLKDVTRKMWLVLTGCIIIPILAVTIDSLIKGGYRSAYEKLMYDYVTCTQSVYTIPGTWLYDALGAGRELTPEIEKEINDWLAARPLSSDSLVETIIPRDNCIIILCESFESWLIGANVDGIEITPRLNAFLKEDSVFYAPNMVSQVRGARSIDAQLLIHTGLFPINSGAYSHRFPHTTYMSLDKAFKDKYPGAQSTSFTVDKKIVWNAVVVAQDFGIDNLVDKPFYNLDVATGPRKRLGDHSFFRQTYEKLLDDKYFQKDGHSLIQCVTYSGHTPFIIPDSLKQIRIPEKYPEPLRNY